MNQTSTDPCDEYEHGKICCDTTEDLHRFKENGILKELPNGGSVIQIYPNTTRFMIPPYLKKKPYWLWTEEELVWRNM